MDAEEKGEGLRLNQDLQFTDQKNGNWKEEQHIVCAQLWEALQFCWVMMMEMMPFYHDVNVDDVCMIEIVDEVLMW